jgi:hypothetical protein
LTTASGPNPGALPKLHMSSTPSTNLSQSLKNQLKFNDQPRPSRQTLVPRKTSHHSNPSYWITRRALPCCDLIYYYYYNKLKVDILNLISAINRHNLGLCQTDNILLDTESYNLIACFSSVWRKSFTLLLYLNHYISLVRARNT